MMSSWLMPLDTDIGPRIVLEQQRAVRQSLEALVGHRRTSLGQRESNRHKCLCLLLPLGTELAHYRSNRTVAVHG